MTRSPQELDPRQPHPHRARLAMITWPTTQLPILPSPPFSWFRLLVIAMVGQPCSACHQTSGTVKQAAIAAPARNHRFMTRRDPPLKSAPTKIATAKKPDAVLVRQPGAEDKPADNPARGVAGAPDTNDDERQRRPGQDVEGRCAHRVAGGQEHRHRRGTYGGKYLRRRPPPSSRASNPPTTTVAAVASADHRRRPRSDTPKSDSDTRASNGVRIGWST